MLLSFHPMDEKSIKSSLIEDLSKTLLSNLPQGERGTDRGLLECAERWRWWVPLGPWVTLLADEGSMQADT